MPQVSVLVAAYNAATSIEAALASVQQQSFADWECVVVDDCMLPERLARQVKALEDAPSLCAVGCHVRYQPRSEVGRGRLAYESWLNSQRTADDLRRDRYIEMPVGHPTLMFRIGVLQNTPYREKTWPEDWDLFQRILDGGANIGVVPEALHAWTLSASSLSKQSDNYSLEAFRRCRAHFVAHGFLKDQENYALVGYGDTGKLLRNDLRSYGKTCSLILELHPGRIGQIIEGAPVKHHEALAQQRFERILVSVAGAQARLSLRKMLTDFGYCEGRDFVCTA